MRGTPVLPSLDLDPFDPEVLRDPLAAHAELRDAGPLVELPRYDTYAIARYAEVRAALTNWQDFEIGRAHV